MVDLPLLSVPSLQRQMIGHRSANLTLEQLETLSDEQKATTVLVVQDPFTSYYDAQVVADFVRLVENWATSRCAALLAKWQSAAYQRLPATFCENRAENSDFLNRVAQLGMPMVGVDPALVLCYRDEYKQTLGEKRGDFHVMLVHEWLPSALEGRENRAISGEPWYLFGHCTEVTALPASVSQWTSIFARLGAKLENVSVGAAVWQEPMDMKSRTTPTRWGFTSCPGIRRCSVYRVAAVWRQATPAAAR
jgi:Fe-S oxidoreductase